MPASTFTPQQLLKGLLHRQPESHKFRFGHVLVIGGSPGMVGAPYMAAMAALRTGAGLVTVASGSDVIDKLEMRVNEIMTVRLPLPDADDTVTADETVDMLLAFIKERKVSCLVIGPGQDSRWTTLNRLLLPRLRLPVVVDAGGLKTIAEDLKLLSVLAAVNDDVILTPHPGEFATLAGWRPPADDPADLAAAVQSFADEHHVHMVYKNHRTLVVHASQTRPYRNTTGNPGMATAGSGDVLAGVIAGLLAQSLSAHDASQAGVYLHGLAGDMAARRLTEPAMIAGDIIDGLTAAFRTLQAASGMS